MSSSAVRRLTQEEVEAEPWRFSPSVYGAVLGVHEPYFAETSTHQIALMNGRERKDFDARSTAAWAAWFAVRDTWREGVEADYRAGRFYKGEDDVTDEARSVARKVDKEVTSAAYARELESARRWNEAPELEKGSRVWDCVAKCYAILEASYKRSARVHYVDGETYMLAFGSRKVPSCTLHRFSEVDLLRVEEEA